jgi:hypothetical protein
MLGKSTSVIDCTHCINLCSQNNDVDHISEEVLNSPDGHIKINVDHILYRPSVKIRFPLKFQIVYYIVQFLNVGSDIEVTNGIRHAYTPKPIILSRVRVTIDTGFRIGDWIY